MLGDDWDGKSTEAMNRYDNKGSKATKREIHSRYSEACREWHPGADISGGMREQPPVQACELTDGDEEERGRGGTTLVIGSLAAAGRVDVINRNCTCSREPLMALNLHQA